MPLGRSYIVVCVSLLLGAVMGAAFHSTLTPVEGPSAVVDLPPGLSLEIQALASAVAEAKSALRPSVMDRPHGSRSPLGPGERPLSANDLREILSTLEVHRCAASQPLKQLSDAGKSKPLRGGGALFGSLANFRNEDFDWRERGQALSDEHFLWSIHDLIRCYGLPKEVRAGEEFEIVYQDPASELEVRFRIRESVVYYVYLAT